MRIRAFFRRAEAESKLPESSALFGGSGTSRLAIAGRVFQRIEFALLYSGAAMFLLLLPAWGGPPKSAILSGMVRDSAGKAVGDAHVVLREEKSQLARETATDAAGRFTFSGVDTGTYVLTARFGTARSATASITVSSSGEHSPVDLTLDASGAQRSASAAKDASQAMQFADDPNFAIAAVTDWTAAGGHGSDSILRASEALTQQAMMLKPGSKADVNGVVPGEETASESALRAALAKDPNGFEANYRLGLFYVQTGRYGDAIPPLQAAYRADPANFDNEYDLAQSLKMTDDTAQAREHVQHLLARRPSADLHHMDGELDEKLGDPLSAVREFQEAASEDPSEENYFAWGSELLFHRAIWQAKEVFDEGAKLYPQSARMLTARGAALFAGALYDQAALDLCKASDLNPESAEPYLFMGKIEIAAPDPLPCVLAKLKRFEQLQPANSLANYYYAMALWKQQGHATDPQIIRSVKDLLTRAVTLDPECADGYLQLGNLSARQNQWEQAVAFYLKAIHANPDLSEVHYRLGVAYERTGENAKAREQFQLHDAIAKEQAAEIQRQRLAVKQFVVLPDREKKQDTRH